MLLFVVAEANCRAADADEPEAAALDGCGGEGGRATAPRRASAVEEQVLSESEVVEVMVQQDRELAPIPPPPSMVVVVLAVPPPTLKLLLLLLLPVEATRDMVEFRGCGGNGPPPPPQAEVGTSSDSGAKGVTGGGGGSAAATAAGAGGR